MHSPLGGSFKLEHKLSLVRDKGHQSASHGYIETHVALSPGGRKQSSRKHPLNLERMEHTLEDGTVRIEDKLLQNHNVNNFTSKDKFPGLRLDSTKFGPLWLRRLGKTVRRSEDVGVRHDGLNGCYMEPSTHAGNTSISQAAPAPVS